MVGHMDSLLFDVNLINLFYECEESDIGSYADDTMSYSCGTDTQNYRLQLINFFIGLNTTTLKSTLVRAIFF